MDTKTKAWLALSALCALLSACSSSKDCGKGCPAPLTCDKEDGVCKCGGRGGVVCSDGYSCEAETNSCVATRCGSVNCSNGTSCDSSDAKCKCGGANGVVCAEGQVCNPVAKACAAPVDCAQVACPKNQTCNPNTGSCVCGLAACPAGKSCAVATDGSRTCVDNACSGVTCLGNNACDSKDGLCKCNGAVCQTGEACGCPVGSTSCEASARACAPSSLCVGKSCPNQQTCDPVDGQCKCGGPGAPACTPDQICRLDPPMQCQGGQQCQNADGSPKTCATGTSCDPEDGKCKCGGRGGVVCAAATATDPADVCVSSSLQKACHRPCDPRSPDCSSGSYCYFDATVATPVAYCILPTDSRGEGSQCVSATACYSDGPPRSMHCVGLGSGGSGICRSYCDVAAGPSGCPQTTQAQNCLQITGAPEGVGYCQPT
jgi:hypothetical protein